VRELEPRYTGQIEFVIVPAAETLQRLDEIKAYGFTDLKHGLVGFNSDGEALVKIPGHNFGRPEIVAAIDVLLAE
jgi:hypothetical protein